MFGGPLPLLETQRWLLFQERLSQLDYGVWWRGVEWAVPEVSFKGMFNFHSLFLKSHFLQRHEE